MANSSINPLVGNCIAPFLDASKFPGVGGFPEGRLCATITSLPHSPTCCLPCPATEWLYPGSFDTYNTVTGWLHVVGVILLLFLLLSYAVLPTEHTRSHYLSVCLVVAALMLSIGFTVPLAANPDKCYNEITPNDMYSSMTCAWSGALIVAGGLSAGAWIFMRALSMNLQICWDIVPGTKFFYASQAVGWGVPAAFFASTLVATGVSFRFGDACHVNHDSSIKDFWGPLIAMAGGASLLQLGTFGYCIYIYLQNLWTETQPSGTESTSGSQLPTHAIAASQRAQTGRAVWRRLQKVLWLQWRGICIVTIILVDVIFFTVVFLYLDRLQSSIQHDLDRVLPWLLCLASNPDHREKCLDLAQGWLVSEAMVAAVLFLLSIVGWQVFFLLGRFTIISAWIDFLRKGFSGNKTNRDFVSIDAKHDPEVERSTSQRHLISKPHNFRRVSTATFEMQKPATYPRISALALDLKEDGSEFPNSYLQDPSPSSTAPSTANGQEWSPSGIDKGRLPTEYIGRITPRSTFTLDHSAQDYAHHPPSSPPTSQIPNPRRAYTRQDSYSPSSPPSQTAFHDSYERERTYQPHHASFSAPGRPGSAHGGSTGVVDDREKERRRQKSESQLGLGLNGLRLSPPEEVAEREREGRL